LTVVHCLIGQPVGVCVLLAADVLETDMSNLVREELGLGVQGLEPGVFDFEASEHLLNEQKRVGSNMNGPVAVSVRPFKRCKQAVVLGHVVRGDTNGPLQFVDQRSIGALDPNSVSGRTGIAARAAVDIGDYGIRHFSGLRAQGLRVLAASHHAG
jgi:hypothetical protein